MSKNSDLQDCPCCPSDCAGTWRLEPNPCSCSFGESWTVIGCGCRKDLADGVSVKMSYEIWMSGTLQDWPAGWFGGPETTGNCREFGIAVVEGTGKPVELCVLWQYDDGCVHVETASLILREPL